VLSYLKHRKQELKDDISKLEQHVRDLEHRKTVLDNIISTAQTEAKNAREDVLTAKQEAVYKCAPAVDLRSMRAFSVERMYKDGELVTIIGYIKPDNSIGEWVLYCSATHHNSIVNEFRMIVKVPE
jgi:chromosome segregation ATPase